MLVMLAPGLRAVSRMRVVHKRGLGGLQVYSFVGLLVGSLGLVRSFAFDWRRGIARTVHRPEQRIAFGEHDGDVGCGHGYFR